MLADELDKDGQIDSSDLSHIAFIPLDNNSSSAGTESSTEWTVTLPPGEVCDSICLVADEFVNDNRGYSVVITSKRFMRIFAQPAPSLSLAYQSSSLHLPQITKLGLPPISVPGHNVVSTASHPTKPILAVVICGLMGELQWRLFYLGGMLLGEHRTRIPSWFSKDLTIWQSLPISPSLVESNLFDRTKVVRLTWFGFSDTGSLFTHDSTGVVRRLIHGRKSSNFGCEFHWAPVCNTRSMLKITNRRTDNYFLLGVVESTFESSQSDQNGGFLQVIYCKGSKWPRVFPRPLVSSLSFQLPLCALDTDQGALEVGFFSKDIFLTIIIMQL